jgi:hypothetical protein
MGTVQGSIPGPILYTIFVSLILDLEFMFTFADNNYVPNCAIPDLIKVTEKALESITKGLRDLGLVFNQSVFSTKEMWHKSQLFWEISE